MQKQIRYYIQTAGQQPVVRSVSVDRPAESPSARPEVQQQAQRPQNATVSGVRRIRAAIKRGGI